MFAHLGPKRKASSTICPKVCFPTPPKNHPVTIPQQASTQVHSSGSKLNKSDMNCLAATCTVVSIPTRLPPRTHGIPPTPRTPPAPPTVAAHPPRPPTHRPSVDAEAPQHRQHLDDGNELRQAGEHHQERSPLVPGEVLGPSSENWFGLGPRVQKHDTKNSAVSTSGWRTWSRNVWPKVRNGTYSTH